MLQVFRIARSNSKVLLGRGFRGQHRANNRKRISIKTANISRSKLLRLINRIIDRSDRYHAQPN